MTTTFRDGAFLHVYFFELWSLGESISSKCAQVFKSCRPAEGHGYIKVDPALHATIASLLGEAANVKKMLNVPSKPGFRETDEQFAFHRERCEVVAQIRTAG